MSPGLTRGGRRAADDAIDLDFTERAAERLVPRSLGAVLVGGVPRTRLAGISDEAKLTLVA